MHNPFDELADSMHRIEHLLLELKTQLPAPFAPAYDEIGGIDLAQQVTGLAKSTLYDLVCKKEVPYMKRGKKLYFSRLELLTWIQEGRRATRSELETQATQFLRKKREK
jgi:predicted DNA-binding transcriptional regulator AlpA